MIVDQEVNVGTMRNIAAPTLPTCFSRLSHMALELTYTTQWSYPKSRRLKMKLIVMSCSSGLRVKVAGCA